MVEMFTADTQNTEQPFVTTGQAMSWYHKKIPRIPHRISKNRLPGKEYLTDAQILELFDGAVVLQEKVDGHLSAELINIDKAYQAHKFRIYEDFSGKNTPHSHIMQYKYPGTRKATLDEVIYDWIGKCYVFRAAPDCMLTRASFNFTDVEISVPDIYVLLEGLARLPSFFHAPKIEGLIIKNYSRQLMAKYINIEFEDAITEVR